MRNFLRKYWCIILFGVCLVWAVLILFRNPHPHTQIVHTTDTVYITKFDTLELVSPIFVEKKVVDTFFVYVNDSTNIPLPIEQKKYSEPNKYELYISGVNPNLDTIRVFNKTEYRTVTNTVTHTVYKNAWRGYIGGQISIFDSQVIPTINLMFVSPKTFTFGAGIGIYDNKPVYQFNVSYKIFGK